MGSVQQTTTTTASQPSLTATTPSKPAPASYAPERSDRGVCKDAVTAPGCTLTADERTSLVSVYRADVVAIASQCQAALTQLAIEEEIRNTNEVPWYAQVILSAVAAVLTDGLSLALEAGVAAGAAMTGLARAGSAASAELSAEIRTMFDVVALNGPPPAPSTLPHDTASKAVDAAKGAISPGVAEHLSTDTDATKDKAQRQAFVEELRQMMSTKFKRLSNEPPKTLNDADLIALERTLQPDDPRYQSGAMAAEFRAAIDRFMKSPASKIGRRTGWDEKRDNKRFELETRVAWLITKGAGKRLIYVDRAFSSWFQAQNKHLPSWAATSRSAVYDDRHRQLSLQDEAEWQTPLGSERHRESPVGPDMMLKYVEPEFIELALKMQHEIWQATPETFMLDYSYAPPKMIKVAG